MQLTWLGIAIAATAPVTARSYVAAACESPTIVATPDSKSTETEVTPGSASSDSLVRTAHTSLQTSPSTRSSVTSPSRDDLQEAMRQLREQDFGVALQFGNYRG